MGACHLEPRPVRCSTSSTPILRWSRSFGPISSEFESTIRLTTAPVRITSACRHPQLRVTSAGLLTDESGLTRLCCRCGVEDTGTVRPVIAYGEFDPPNGPVTGLILTHSQGSRMSWLRRLCRIFVSPTIFGACFVRSNFWESFFADYFSWDWPLHMSVAFFYSSCQSRTTIRKGDLASPRECPRLLVRAVMA